MPICVSTDPTLILQSDIHVMWDVVWGCSGHLTFDITSQWFHITLIWVSDSWYLEFLPTWVLIMICRHLIGDGAQRRRRMSYNNNQQATHFQNEQWSWSDQYIRSSAPRWSSGWRCARPCWAASRAARRARRTWCCCTTCWLRAGCVRIPLGRGSWCRLLCKPGENGKGLK